MLENINLLTSDQIEQYNEKGYILIKNAIDDNLIREAIHSYKNMRKKCENKKYFHLRRYNNLSRSDIYAIEDIFHPDIFESNILKSIMKSKVLEYSSQLLNDNCFLSLSRLHCTKYFSHSGYWHRDHGMPKKNLEFIDKLIFEKNYMHVQSTLPFYDEEGFYVIPGSHKKSKNYIDTLQVMGTPHRKIFEKEERIFLKAGDLILFNPLIIHRGTCKGRIKYQRAHIHMRFSKVSKAKLIGRNKNDYIYYNQEKVLRIANNNWKKMFSLKLDPSSHWREEIIVNPNEKFTLRNNVGLIKNRIKYNLTKFMPFNNRKIENMNSIIFPYLK